MFKQKVRWAVGGLFLALLLGLGSLPSSPAGEAQICPPEVREEFLMVWQELTPEQIELRFGGCREDVVGSGAALPGQSNFYEEIEGEACGYEPQDELLTCTIIIKEPFGFGGPIGVGPGSLEWILFCVDFGWGLRPVNLESVHLHDAPTQVPPWYFAVVMDAQHLGTLPLDGYPLSARAILAWTQIPHHCWFHPIWGEIVDFQIRLDP